MSMTDFSILQQAYDAGTEAAEKSKASLHSLAISEAAYAQYQQKKAESLAAQRLDPHLHIDKILIDNQSTVHNDYVLDNFPLNTQKASSLSAINHAINYLYASDEFEKVDIRFIPAQESDTKANIARKTTPPSSTHSPELINSPKPINSSEPRNKAQATVTTPAQKHRSLIIDTRSKSWGPNYLRFGFGFEEDLTEDTTFSLDIAYNKTNLSLGGNLSLMLTHSIFFSHSFEFQ